MADSTKSGRLRVLYVATHPIQYLAPVLRKLASEATIDLQVAYCSMQGVTGDTDPGFGVAVKWDVPLLDGYPWVQLPNRARHPGVGRFFGLVNPTLWKLVRHGNFDAVITQTGYAYLTYWILMPAARMSRTPVIFCTDASSIRPFDSKTWKNLIKPLIAPQLFGLNQVIAASSTAGCELFSGMGIPEERIVLAPFVVDNEWWTREAAKVDRQAVRQRWNIPERSPVILFCAKLQPWKRPLDLLQAFAKAGGANAYLVFAGDGPVRPDLERVARDLGVAERVRMLGFVNQSRLPEVYRGSDVLVLPSEYEPFAVVLNEAMLCGCAVIASDRVGAGRDLVQAGVTGFIFPYGDVEALAELLRELINAPERLQAFGMAARNRMQSWSPSQHIATLVDAVTRVAASRAAPHN